MRLSAENRPVTRGLALVVIGLAACSDGEPEGAAGPSGADAGASDGRAQGDAAPGPGDGGAAAFSGLALEPPRADLVSRGPPVRQTFTVRATRADGTTRDVTAEAQLTLEDESLGRLSGARFVTGTRGGTTRLRAEFEGLRAEAEIRVRVERTEDATSGAPLPNDPGGLLDGAPSDGGREAPQIVYPSSGVLLPPNLSGFELHYRPGAADNTLFRVTFEGAGVRIAVHTRCRPLGAGCLYRLPPALWASVAGTTAGRAPFAVTVEGTDEQGTAKSASAPVSVSVAPQPVEGGLYYWSTSLEAIMRVDFGAQAAPEQFWPPPGTRGGPCYGCHALSPDGQRMTLSENGQYDGKLTLLEVSSRTPLVRASDAIREQFQSWHPDSTRFAAVYGDDDPPDTRLRIRDGETARVLASIDLGFEASHVDWSPAGDRIAFTRVTRHFTSQRPGRGGIAYIQRTEQGWSAPRDLVPPADGVNHYTPAYSPDGEILVYGRSTCPNGQIYTSTCDGDADPSSKLWAISKDGGRPIRLDAVNAAGPEDGGDDLSNTFPKWAPFVDPREADGSGRLMWMTFSSRRRYGLRPPVGNNQLLWMVAIDPDAILAGRDGSHPPFALAFQDLQTSNHIAQWTRRVVPTDPPDGGAPPDAGRCVPRGGACTPGADACCANLACVEGAAGTPVCAPAF